MDTRLAAHPAGRRELVFFAGCGLCALFLVNMTLFGGFQLGFALGVTLSILWSAGYLLAGGCKKDPYALSLLALCLVIAASFPRGNDGPVKFVLVCFLGVGINLGLGLLARQNRRDPGSAASLGDAGYVAFGLGFGELPESTRGLGNALREAGSLGRTGAAVALGLGLAAPVLFLLVPLLMGADAAFEGLLDRLPAFSVTEFVATVVLGGCLSFVFYTRGATLRFHRGPRPVTGERRGLPVATVNTLLGAVVFVYAVYLLSQLAYFVGGFSGLLPEDYTLAQYARRGFFEMAGLCALNLGILAFAMSLCRTRGSTRLLCMFIGLVTVFLAVSAGGKMALYIRGYGLTRLRVLTLAAVVFLALVTVLVTLKLFLPGFGYMKPAMLAALLLGAALSWTDVDTLVARYNTQAYLTGALEEVDMAHMGSLGNGALPHIHRLRQEAEDPLVRQMAGDLIAHWEYPEGDWRSWNYVNQQAKKYLPEPPEDAQWAAQTEKPSRGLYLLVGEEQVAQLLVTTPGGSGGCANADGSLMAPGDRVWLSSLAPWEFQDGLEGVCITALDAQDREIWSVNFPEGTPVTLPYREDAWYLDME